MVRRRNGKGASSPPYRIARRVLQRFAPRPASG
jgi:hypothetical protein